MKSKVCCVRFNVVNAAAVLAIMTWKALMDLIEGFECLPGLLFTLLQHILWSFSGRQWSCGVTHLVGAVFQEHYDLTSMGL